MTSYTAALGHISRKLFAYRCLGEVNARWRMLYSQELVTMVYF